MYLGDIKLKSIIVKLNYFDYFVSKKQKDLGTGLFANEWMSHGTSGTSQAFMKVIILYH